LADPVALETACTKILEKEKGVYLLVNNAKYFGQNSFEEMSLSDMERVLKINLLCPLIMMRVLGESLRTLQGYIIQLGAPYAESSNGGAVGAASAGGLKWMGEQFFNEYRNNGVKVCHLSPEANRARDARMRIRRGARPEASIDPEAIAQAIEQILQSPFGNVVTEMIIRPLRIDEPEHEPVKKIPYPDPQPIPYTVPREFIDAEEQLEEDEWKKQQQRKHKRQSAKKQPVKKKADPKKSKEVTKKQTKREEPKEKSTPQDSPDKQSKPRRRSRRKPKPPNVVVGFHDKQPGENQPIKDSTKKEPKQSDEKPAEKASAKKRTGKTVKKAAKKTQIAGKNAAKKASKKVSKREPDKVVKKIVKKVVGTKPAKKTPIRESTKKNVKEKVAKKAVKKAVRKTAKKAAKKGVAKKAPNRSGKDAKSE
jgi:NADP-dependent 3-hydroxy acid dehydrogenase YdfG